VKNIIVVSDLSERSRPAVQRAVNFAADINAKLTVLHVVDDSMPGDLSKQLQAGARVILNEQVTENAGGRDIAVEIEVFIGDVIEKISQFIDDNTADLLVVGPHRRRKLFDQIRETTMEQIVRSSRLPVLLVTGQADKAYDKVLIGIDLSGICATVLNKVRMVAPQSNLTLFHAHEISFRKRAELDYETWIARYSLPTDLPDPIFVEATADDGLHEMMSNADYDLLAIGAHSRSNVGRYFLGSLAAGLIRKPLCDLLIAK